MGWFTSEVKQTVDTNGQKVKNILLQDSSSNILVILMGIMCALMLIEFIIYLYVQNNKRIYARAERAATAERINRDPAV